MAAEGKSGSGAPPPAELAAPVPTSDTDATVRIDAEEFARLEERKVVERAWREQEEYARAVAALKKKVGWRECVRRTCVWLKSVGPQDWYDEHLPLKDNPAVPEIWR